MDQSDEKLSPEQIAKRKEQMLEFFKEQIPFLKKQKEYEELTTEIDELRTRRVRAQAMMAQILAPHTDEDLEDSPTDKKE